MTWLFGILGAVASVVYWRHAVSVDPLLLPADSLTVGWEGLIYAAAGFVAGWVIGFALSKIGHD